MMSRPVILVILAAIQAIAPFVDVGIGSIMTSSPYWQFAQKAMHAAPFKFWFNLFGTQFLAAWAIYRPRLWSIPICLGVFLLNLHDTASLSEFRTNPWAQILIVGSNVGNAVLVFYFLLPAVRQVYVDRKLRWWENAPRFKVNIPASVEIDGERTECLISDLSTGGVLITGEKLPEVGSKVTLAFEHLSFTMSLPSVVRHRGMKSKLAAGIEFQGLEHRAQHDLKALTKLLEESGAAHTIEKPSFWDELGAWAYRLVTTGSGLIPEPYRKPAAPSPNSASAQVIELPRKEKRDESDEKKAA